MKLNLGCGKRIEYGYINLDKPQLDFNKFPWKLFTDNAFEEIRIWNSIQCSDNFNAFMNEVWRVAEPNAKICIKVQYFNATEADPMTKTLIGYTSFNNLKHKFKILKRRWIFSDHRLLSWLNFVPNIFPKLYARFFYFYFPSDKLYFELEAIK